VHNFYRLLAASEEKVHDGTDIIMLQAVTHLMTFKSKYNFSNQCYNDIMKLIIDLIPVKHYMMKDLYQSKKIVSDLKMNYEKIDACEKITCYFGRITSIIIFHFQFRIQILTHARVKLLCYRVLI
jgi:hypothetical protein